uniref:serine/arginine repetitive matrix protein 1-like n=1 Tax=Arvicanthis niloticus TaxID=61156 RepID=UPI0014868D69|nr:serine/arginine repetitive matrix protein 1-like [Arvicanthis niloticus]
MPESRSLSELTRQIAPPTKNGHAPPPTESRKSYQSVNPVRVRAGFSFATILPPEPKDFGFPEAARRVMGITPPHRQINQVGKRERESPGRRRTRRRARARARARRPAGPGRRRGGKRAQGAEPRALDNGTAAADTNERRAGTGTQAAGHTPPRGGGSGTRPHARRRQTARRRATEPQRERTRTRFFRTPSERNTPPQLRQPRQRTTFFLFPCLPHAVASGEPGRSAAPGAEPGGANRARWWWRRERSDRRTLARGKRRFPEPSPPEGTNRGDGRGGGRRGPDRERPPVKNPTTPASTRRETDTLPTNAARQGLTRRGTETHRRGAAGAHGRERGPQRAPPAHGSEAQRRGTRETPRPSGRGRETTSKRERPHRKGDGGVTGWWPAARREAEEEGPAVKPGGVVARGMEEGGREGRVDERAPAPDTHSLQDHNTRTPPQPRDRDALQTASPPTRRAVLPPPPNTLTPGDRPDPTCPAAPHSGGPTARPRVGQTRKGGGREKKPATGGEGGTTRTNEGRRRRQERPRPSLPPESASQGDPETASPGGDGARGVEPAGITLHTPRAVPPPRPRHRADPRPTGPREPRETPTRERPRRTHRRRPPETLERQRIPTSDDAPDAANHRSPKNVRPRGADRGGKTTRSETEHGRQRRGTGSATTSSEAGTLAIKAGNAPGAPEAREKPGAHIPDGKGHAAQTDQPPSPVRGKGEGQDGTQHRVNRRDSRAPDAPTKTPRTTTRSARGSAFGPDSRTPAYHTPPAQMGRRDEGPAGRTRSAVAIRME